MTARASTASASTTNGGSVLSGRPNAPPRSRSSTIVLANRRAAPMLIEKRAAYRPVRLSAGLGVCGGESNNSRCGCSAALRFANAGLAERRRPTFSKTAGNVLVQHAGDKRLIGDAFGQRSDLNVTQITRRKSNVNSPILDRSCPSGCFVPGQLSLCRNRGKLSLLKGTQNFPLIRINLLHRVHPASSSPESPCDSG